LRRIWPKRTERSGVAWRECGVPLNCPFSFLKHSGPFFLTGLSLIIRDSVESCTACLSKQRVGSSSLPGRRFKPYWNGFVIEPLEAVCSRTSRICVPPTRFPCMRDQFVAEGFMATLSQTTPLTETTRFYGRRPRKTSRRAQRRNRRVSDWFNAVDDGEDVVSFSAWMWRTHEPVMENSGLQSDSCGVVWLLS